MELAARLHEAAAGLAVGIAILKEGKPHAGGTPAAIDALEQVADQLRDITRARRPATPRRHRPATVADHLTRAAELAGIDLNLELIGNPEWLIKDHASLLSLVGREAIRNVRRHSGVGSCRIIMDVSSCPFVMRVRDWGAGLIAGVRAGDGIAILEQLARGLGCQLALRSQAGLGTELVLTGPACPRNAGTPTPRSEVAEESLGSRGIVAGRRPLSAPRQQIT